MTEQELKLWNEFNDAYNAEFKNLPFDSADEEFLFKRGCWWAWQASRQALVVRLPDSWDSNTGIGSYSSDVRSALDEAGVKYNEQN